MKNLIQISIVTLIATIATADAQTIFVPGTANPWLAGMPDGTTVPGGDSAPAESPVFAFNVAGGQNLTFSVTGAVAQGPGDPLIWTPDGNTSYGITGTVAGGANNIAGLTGPIDALLGVFLNDSLPTANPTPASLDFSSAASRDYLTLSPALQQPFFIGDGLTSSLAVQQIIAPTGATRLYLGVLDSDGWFNNIGSYNVTVAPEPGCAGLLILGCLLGIVRRSRKGNDQGKVR